MAEPIVALGDPIKRLDGLVKVTGTAQFPSDVPAGQMAHAMLLTSTVALGTIRSIDPSRAEAVPGFLLLLTHRNTQGEMKTPRGFAGRSTTTVETDRVMHDGQIIGLVGAETVEAARKCARAVVIDYGTQQPAAGFGAPGAVERAVRTADTRHEDPVVGDAAAAIRAAPVTIDARYSTPIQHHNPIELFTTTCWWSGKALTVQEPSQFVLNRGELAQALAWTWTISASSRAIAAAGSAARPPVHRALS